MGFWCLFCTLGDLGAPFGLPLGTFGHHLGTLGRHLGIRGIQYRVCLLLWAVALDTLGHFSEKGSKKTPKMIEKGTTNGSTFDDILCFCRKWQTAFGSSRLDRIGVRPLCFRPLWSLMGSPRSPPKTHKIHHPTQDLTGS